MDSRKMKFTGKDDGLNIEDFLQHLKAQYQIFWICSIGLHLKDEANKWWTSLDSAVRKLLEKKLEKVILDKWSKDRKKDTKRHKDLFSTNISILQVHGSIQKENIVVSIIPSCKHNCINVNLAKKLQVPAKHIENTG